MSVDIEEVAITAGAGPVGPPSPDVRPIASSDLESQTDIPIENFPPRPTPNVAVRRSEASCGIIFVLVLVVLLPTICALLSFFGNQSMTLNAVFLCILGVCAILAVTGLICMLRDDNMGTIERCPENCYPVPPKVATKLRAGEMLPLNNIAGENGRTFCVRCLVWRPPKSHHCRVCGLYAHTHGALSVDLMCTDAGVCVADFDHHW